MKRIIGLIVYSFLILYPAAQPSSFAETASSSGDYALVENDHFDQ